MLKKRLLSAFLVLCLALSLLPATVLQAAAADSTGTTDMNALSALGIDTSAAPEGYDPDSKSNPYGKDTVTLNPVGEFYTVGLDAVTATNGNIPIKNADRDLTVTKSLSQTLSGTLYGHEKWSLTTAPAIMSNTNANKETIASGTSTVTGTYKASGVVTSAPSALQSIDTVTTVGGAQVALTAVAAGNFDGNTAGLEAQSAMLYTSKLSKNGGLYLKLGDTTTGTYGTDAITLLPTSASIGNPSASLDGVTIETFDSAPYLLQNYLQLTTGDYDGDGKDEIAVYIPEYGKSRIVVYKLKSTSGGSNYQAANDWQIAWTYSLKETTYVSNMVSLVSGDFNADGVDDLAATWGYYYGPQDNKGSTAVVLFGSAENGKMLQSSQEFPLTYGTSAIVRGAFAYGDITGGGADTLILGGQLNGDLAAGKLSSRFIAFYTWDGDAFVQTQAKNYDLFETDDDGHLLYSAMAGRSANVFYSSPLCVANIDVIGQGLGEDAMLYFDSLLFNYSDEGLSLTAALDNQATMQSDASKPVSYVEYGAVATDLVGLGKETLMTLRQTFSSTTTESFSETKPAQTYSYYDVEYYYKSWFHELFDLKSWRQVLRTITLSAEETVTDTNVYYHPGAAYQVTLDPAENYKTSTAVDVSASLCVANTDNDTTYLNYAGKNFVYSDPEILAVLASPPYFADLLDRDDLSGSYGESATSYSTTSGGSTGVNASATISAGAYVSVEQEFSVFGISAAKAEAEVAVTAGFTYEYEQSASLEQTVSYSAVAGEDMVAFYSLPLEVFTFNASVPDGQGGYNTQVMTVNIPHEAAVKLISLDDYEAIAADYDVLPKIADNVLTHTVGDPASYPSSTNGYQVIAEYDGSPASVGFSSSGAAISQEIAMSKESSNAFSASVGIETKIGAGAGGVVVGVTVGAEVGAGYVTTTTSGSSFSGELQNMPLEAQEYSYGYNWRIFAYRYTSGSSSFPVVSYAVSDVTSPPSLPTDFEQDVASTTGNAVVLTWSSDKAVAGFQLYRYYEFPEGSGSYELAFVPASAGVQKDGRYYYSYTDDGLAPYTEYQYQIQTVRASVPNNSIKSEVLVARTKTASGYPNIRLDGLTDGVLNIYPDAMSTVTATVVNAEDYPDGLSYQWQILTDSGWNNMSGQKTKTLTFASAGSADQAQYRCRINTIYYDEGQGETYYITAYSDPLSTVYSKRTAMAENAEEGLTATVTGQQLDLSLSLISAHSGHNTAPTGTVTFIISGVDYSATATGTLAANGATADGKNIGTATASVQNLSDGVYEVTAIYNGSRIFKSLTLNETETVLIGNAAGYQLNLTSGSSVLTSFVYGDSVTPVLNQVELIGNAVTITPQTSDVTFDIYDSDGDKVNGSIITGAYDTPDAGTYTLVAKVSGNVVARRGFTVTPKPVTVMIADKSAGAGSVEANLPAISLAAGSALAFSETLESLHLVVIAKNSADNVIALDNSTEPGNYTVTPAPGTSSQLGNYEVTYTSGVYTVTAQTYSVTCEAEKVQGTLAGTVLLTNEGTKFSASTELLFVASAYNGYEVDTWTVTPVGATQPALTDTSGKSKLSYTMQDEAINVTVTFKKVPLTLSTFTQGSGTITLPQYFTSGSVVTSGAEMQFTAVPAEGYHFVKWEEIENNVTTQLTGTQNADGSNTLSFTMGDFNSRLYAYFERDSYTLTLGDNLKASYLWDHDGLTETPMVEKTIVSGASIVGDTVVTVSPKAGYVVPDIAEWQITGSQAGTAPAGNQSYAFTLTADTGVSVETERGTYAVTLSAANGTVAAMLDGVTADADALTAVPGGTSVTVTATPDYGYAFDYWEVNGVTSTQTERTYIQSELGGPLNITAHFTQLTPYAVNIAFDNPLRATFTYTLVDALGRTQASAVAVTPAAGGDSIDVYAGDTLTVSVLPAANFMVGKWIIDGGVVDSRQKTYTFANIGTDTDVEVDMVAQSSHTVTYGTGISGATADGQAFVSDSLVGGGTTVVFTAAPGSGEMVSGWTLNGQSVLNEYGQPLVTETYTIDGLAGDAAVGVAFAAQAFHTVTVTAENIAGTSAFEPMLDGKIRDGAAGVFTFTANTGYRLDKADLEDLQIFDTVSDPDDAGTYTCVINAIRADITITLAAKQLYTVTAAAANGGTVTASPGTAAAGDIVTLTATPTSGSYRLADLRAYYSDAGGGETDLTLTDSTFTMPAADVTVTASFVYAGGGGGGGAPAEEETFTATGTAGWGGSISPESASVESGKPVSFTITPSDGYKVSDVTVDGVSVGAVHSYTVEAVSADVTVSARFKKDIKLPDIGEWENPFEDVSEDDWFYEAVGFVSQMGMFNGTGDGAFGADDTTTRAMLVTVLYRFENPSDRGAGHFEDVDADAWYAEAVLWASDNEIVSGVGENQFGPDDNITREQLATILYRYAKLVDGDTSKKGDLSVFDDTDEVSDFASDAMAWAVGEGFISGKGNGVLDPGGEATRAEVAAILMRFIEALAE